MLGRRALVGLAAVVSALTLTATQSQAEEVGGGHLSFGFASGTASSGESVYVDWMQYRGVGALAYAEYGYGEYYLDNYLAVYYGGNSKYIAVPVNGIVHNPASDTITIKAATADCTVDLLVGAPTKVVESGVYVNSSASTERNWVRVTTSPKTEHTAGEATGYKYTYASAVQYQENLRKTTGTVCGRRITNSATEYYTAAGTGLRATRIN